jgi:predicted nucleic acid-binding protein
MILLDTNVLIYASAPDSPHHGWAVATIAQGVSGDGAGINAVTLAEICVGDLEPTSVASRIRSWGVAILDVPAPAAEVCARAYRAYREQRRAASGQGSPTIPLPDFFIGAHAEIMGWPLATADSRRFATYFPQVTLATPSDPPAGSSTPAHSAS